MTRIALLVTVLLCLLPTSVHAATVTGTRVFVEEGVQGLPDSYALRVRYEGEAGEANDVTVRFSGDEVAFEDAGAEIVPGDHCSSDGPSRVVCSSSGDELSLTKVVLGDDDDAVRFEYDRTRLIRVWGEAGSDTLQGGISNERLYGGSGDDVVDGGAGGDTIVGGAGRDQLRAGEPATPYEYDFFIDGERDGSAASDTFVGHPDQALVSYASRRKRVTVDLAAGVAGQAGEHDTLSGITSVVGGKGPDVLLGTNNFDFFRGGAGGDRIEGRGGSDRLDGQAGSDHLLAGAGDDLMSDDSDNARDVQNCGRGEDWVASSDKRDFLLASCEDGAWLQSPRLDATDEVNRITVQPRMSRRRAVFRSTCPHDRCSGRIRLVTPRQRTLLGRGRIEIDGKPSSPRRHDVVAHFTARGRDYLREARRVRVVLLSRDPCGGCLNPRPVKSGFTTWLQRPL